MLVDLGLELVAGFEAMVVTGDALEGLELVQWVDNNIRTNKHPCLTVDLDNGVGFKKVNRGVELTIPYACTLYTVSLKGEIEAERQHQNLLLRFSGGKFKGLLCALARLGTGWTDVHGNCWLVTVEERPRVGIQGPHKHWTIAQTFVLRFTRWFDASAFSQ